MLHAQNRNEAGKYDAKRVLKVFRIDFIGQLRLSVTLWHAPPLTNDTFSREFQQFSILFYTTNKVIK